MPPGTSGWCDVCMSSPLYQLGMVCRPQGSCHRHPGRAQNSRSTLHGGRWPHNCAVELAAGLPHTPAPTACSQDTFTPHGYVITPTKHARTDPLLAQHLCAGTGSQHKDSQGKYVCTRTCREAVAARSDWSRALSNAAAFSSTAAHNPSRSGGGLVPDLSASETTPFDAGLPTGVTRPVQVHRFLFTGVIYFSSYVLAMHAACMLGRHVVYTSAQEGLLE